MPTFLMISRHSPENCALANEKARKVFEEAIGKLPELSKKHGVKTIGAWNVPTEHLTVAVFEAPNLEAWQKCSMEPEILTLNIYNTIEIKLAFTLKEIMKMLP